MACTGVRTATDDGSQGQGWGCTCVPCFFCAQPERGTENRTDLTPKLCYGRKLTLKYTISYCIPSTQSRCGRVCRHPSPSRQLGSGTPRSCERALLQEIFSSGKPRPLHPSRFIFSPLPTEIQHRNKNSINVKLTKTGTGCLRCTSPCSGVRRQVAE